MLAALKAFSGMSLIGGGVCIPWFLIQQKGNGQNKTSSTVVSQTPNTAPSARVTKMEKLVPATPIPKAVKENCKVIDFEDLDNVLFDLGEMETYIPVSCEGTSKDSTEKLPNEWKGLFPDYLFVNTREFNRTGKGFDLATETTVSGDDSTQTVFSGSSLHSSVTGKWGEVTQVTQSGQSISVQTINFEQLQSGKIFLFLN